MVKKTKSLNDAENKLVSASVSVNKKHWQEFGHMAALNGYMSTSELLREMVRKYLHETEK